MLYNIVKKDNTYILFQTDKQKHKQKKKLEEKNSNKQQHANRRGETD